MLLCNNILQVSEDFKGYITLYYYFMVKLNSHALILYFNFKLPTKAHYYYYYAIMLRLVAPYINRLTH